MSDLNRYDELKQKEYDIFTIKKILRGEYLHDEVCLAYEVDDFKKILHAIIDDIYPKDDVK